MRGRGWGREGGRREGGREGGEREEGRGGGGRLKIIQFYVDLTVFESLHGNVRRADNGKHAQSREIWRPDHR